MSFVPANSRRGRQLTSAKGSRIVDRNWCRHCESRLSDAGDGHEDGCKMIEIQRHNNEVAAKKQAKHLK